MKKEKAAENLEKQGRGLTIFLKILGVILLLLNLILLDQEFVPWGEAWEHLKLILPEDTVGMTDKELWAIAKDTLVEEGVVPIKSGFLCWGVCLYRWNEEKAGEAKRAEQFRQWGQYGVKPFAYDEQEREERIKETLFWQDVKQAERVMTIISRFLSENGIETDSLAAVSIYFHDNGIFLNCRDYHSDKNVLDETEKEKLTDLLLENTSVTGEAAAQAYILGEKCTAAAFASKVENITEGTDYPYLGENGQFNTKWRWYGYTAGYTDEIMLDDSARQDNE